VKEQRRDSLRSVKVSNKSWADTFYQKFGMINRVTQLGEFSPIGRLFTLDSFFLIIEVAYVVGILKSYVNFFQIWVWLHFGRLFSPNLSGHPADKTFLRLRR
jgi:hypothetical protein